MDIDPKHLEIIKDKRLKLLLGLWQYFIDTNFLDKNEVDLSYPVVNEILEHYCTDYIVLKYRYRIEGRIERSKIAGLMVALFMRYRPIFIKSKEIKTMEALYANEIIAIVYGLSVCFDDSIESTVKITEEPWFNKWFDDFRYLLHVRHYTSEVLVFLFKTLMIFLKIEDAYNGEE